VRRPHVILIIYIREIAIKLRYSRFLAAVALATWSLTVRFGCWSLFQLLVMDIRTCGCSSSSSCGFRDCVDWGYGRFRGGSGKIFTRARSGICDQNGLHGGIDWRKFGFES
jgi:hypothetical protein